MAYTKTNWVDTVTTVDASKLNNLETGTEINDKEVRALKYIPKATGTATALTITSNSGNFALTEGNSLQFRVGTDGTIDTINIDSTGVKNLRDKDGDQLVVEEDDLIIAIYDTVSGFFLGASRGGVYLTGNAVAGDVLLGKTFYNTDPKTQVVGTIQSNPAWPLSWSATDFHAYDYATPPRTNETVFLKPPAGYYNGLEFIGWSEPNMKASNIKKGVTIGNGVQLTGTYVSESKLDETPTFLSHFVSSATQTSRVNYSGDGWLMSAMDTTNGAPGIFALKIDSTFIDSTSTLRGNRFNRFIAGRFDTELATYSASDSYFFVYKTGDDYYEPDSIVIYDPTGTPTGLSTQLDLTSSGYLTSICFTGGCKITWNGTVIFNGTCSSGWAEFVLECKYSTLKIEATTNNATAIYNAD